jgi:hypothetical protein
MKHPKRKTPTVRRWRHITVQNWTHFRDDDVLAFVRANMAEAGVDTRTCVVKVDYAKKPGRQCEGAAFYGLGRYPSGGEGGDYRVGETRWWRMAFPQDVDNLSEKQIRFACQIAQHEIDHTRGLGHADMIWWGDIPTEFAAGLQMRMRALPVKKAAVPQSRREQSRAELERVEKRIAEIEEKHAATMKRWKKKLRSARASWSYYERNPE